MLACIVAFFSGVVFGVIELCREHPKMKKEAVTSWWGIVYLLGMGATSCAVFLLFGSQILKWLGGQNNPRIGSVVISALSCFCTPFILKKMGSREETGDFVTYHEQISTFLKSEITNSVRVQRFNLAQKIEQCWSNENDELIEITSKAAFDYIEHVEGNMSKQKKEKAKKYIESCVQEKNSLVIVLFLIDNYGSKWAKQNLIKN